MDSLKTAANRFDPPPMPISSEPNAPSMEVAHVLFMDIIGYSKLRMNQQAAAQIELQNLVNASKEVQQAKSERKFICRPTGDGMALLFFRDMVSPVRTALQIHGLMDQRAVAIRAAVGAEIKLRMGIHSGTILMVEDLNAQSDAAGDGINIAQRVMDCGDANHILVSSKVAESLLNADPWQNYLSDLGDVRVKHGVKVHLYNLRGRLDGPYYGNQAIPKKVEADRKSLQDDIKKYRGTFFEQHPEAKGRLLATAILLLVVGVPTYLWKANPGFKKWVQTSYAKVTTLAAHKNSGSANKGNAKNNSGSSGGGKSRGSGGGGSRSSEVTYSDGGDSGPRKVVVPELIGHTLDDATSTAADDKLKVVKSDKSSYNTQYGEGMIYQQSPSPGASVKQGTHIYVRVSKGDPPDAAAAAQAAAATTEKDPDE